VSTDSVASQFYMFRFGLSLLFNIVHLILNSFYHRLMHSFYFVSLLYCVLHTVGYSVGHNTHDEMTTTRSIKTLLQVDKQQRDKEKRMHKPVVK